MNKQLFDDNRVFFLDIRKHSQGIKTPGIMDKLNESIIKVLQSNFALEKKKNAIIKVHIGEDPNDTFMRPEIISSSIQFLKNNKWPFIAYGDTTVAYSGPRGYKENPPENVSKYLNLASSHNFQEIPFIVLDRPISALDGFQFNNIHKEITVDDPRIRYKKIYPSGGFLASDLVIIHSHLTGHLLAKNALHIKSICMGLSSYKGKIQLHQNLYPEIDPYNCTLCEECVNQCPEKALSLLSDSIKLDVSVCIGCGQCGSICPESAISMESAGISNWNKGKDSLDVRMAEYTIALLDNFPGKMVYIGHLYTITGICDCMSVHQKPNCRDIGITIGLNPFATDFASCTLEGLMKAGDDASWDLDSMKKISAKSLRYEVYHHVKENFQIDFFPQVHRIEI